MAETTYKIQHPKKAAFLAAYATCGNVSQAARAAEMDRSMHYDWLKNDEEYAMLFGLAEGEAADSLLERARELAMEGWEEEVYYEGSQCGTKRKHCTTLLIFLLKGVMPEKFGDRVRHAGDPTQPIAVGPIAHQHTIRVIYDDDFYGNGSKVAEAETASAAGDAERQAFQASYLRSKVDEDGTVADSEPSGPR